MFEYVKYINLGLALVSPAIVGLIIGRLLDGVFGTFPVITAVFLILGILSGIWSMYKAVKEVI